MVTQGTPHGIVNRIFEAIAGGAKGLGSSVKGGLQGVGNGVQRGLDAPWQAVGAPEQPLHVVDRFLDGGLDATDNALSRGAIETAEMGSRTVTHALDHPVEQFGVPPDMGDMGMGGKFPRPPSPMQFGRKIRR